jgi:hypothetical protein
MRPIPWTLAGAALLALSACTDQFGNSRPLTDAERAAIGAGAGAITADVLDQNVVAGAAIGAGAGALADDAGLVR